MTANTPFLNAPLLAVLLGLIEFLRLRVADLEDQVAAARASCESEQVAHQTYRLAHPARRQP